MNSFIYSYFIIHIDFKTNIRNQTTAIDDVTAGKSRSTEHIYLSMERDDTSDFPLPVKMGTG